MFFDTHVHFDEFIQDGSLEAIMANAARAGVSKMLAVGGSPAANAGAQQMAEKFPKQIFAAGGFDRYLAGAEVDFAELKLLLSKPHTVAVGECGLDYFYAPEKAPVQRTLFAQCLELAAAIQKPVIVHTRDADEDTAAMLEDYVKFRRGDAARAGVVHCFTRGRETARRLLDLGFYLSFSGIVTFANADMLRDVVKFVPADRLLLETDSPYLAPVPHRGRRCEPAFAVETAKRLAELRGCTVELLAKITADNAAALFGLQENTQ
ncbi:MAG: TatD family hydrolase [Kiritimatiellales bacterium]